MKRSLSYIVLFFLPALACGQQLPLISHSYLNSMLYNPAYTGIKSSSQIFIFHRNQWNLSNGPVINGFTADKDFKNEKIGLGIGIFNQKAGISEVNKLKINYAYHLQLSDKSKIHFGISPGIIQSRINFSEAIVSDVNDPLLSSGNESTITPDIDAGVALSINNLRLGIALNQAQGSSFSDNNKTPGFSRQFMGSLDYVFSLGQEDKFKIVPLVLVKSTGGVPLQVDFNTSLIWKDLLWIGGSYRVQNAFGANAAVKVKKFRIGYCFEHNKISSYSGITNEISFAYVFNSYKQVKPESSSSVKGQNNQNENDELDRLKKELAEKEDQLIIHEKEIYALIDSLYIRANREDNLTTQEKLDKIEKTQQEINRIKQELKTYNNEKNVEIYKLRMRIDELQRKQND